MRSALYSIRDSVQELGRMRWTQRALMKSKIGDLITTCNTKLDDAVNCFQVRDAGSTIITHSDGCGSERESRSDANYAKRTRRNTRGHPAAASAEPGGERSKHNSIHSSLIDTRMVFVSLLRLMSLKMTA